jgi:hypothetical protein
MNISDLLYFIKHPFFQCIGQEPNPKQFHRLWQRTSRQTNASLSQPLVTWAQYTEAFDSILIFIDVSVLYDACFHLSRATISHTPPPHQTVECIPGSLFQDFLRILTQLRSEHRLPLQVVLLSPPGRGRRLGLDSSAQGTEGILIRDFFLPSSQVLHGTFHVLLHLDSTVYTMYPFCTHSFIRFRLETSLY